MKMPLQTAINADQSVGIPGDRASLNETIYSEYNPIAQEPITIGTFVWGGTDAEKQAKYGGTGTPAGFVERWLAYRIESIRGDSSMVVPAGAALTVAKRGDFWAASSTAATIGQKVFAKTADGSISTAAAGSTVSGSVETDWVVRSAGSIGDPIVISSWD
jgi:hypothetical protein